jgi:hypothetical protein
MKFAFQHLPKCAGTTFQSQLFSWIADGGVIKVLDDRFITTVEPAIFEQSSLLCGHLSTAVLAEVFKPQQVMSCMREPVDRVVSQYFYVRKFFFKDFHNWNSRAYYFCDMQMDPWEDLIRCLRHPEVPYHAHLRNLQTWYLGHHSLHRDISETDVLARAKAWVSELGCLGFTESYDAFIADARAFLGLHEDNNDGPMVKNVNPERPRDQPIPPSVRAEIEKANALDLELYEFARGLRKRPTFAKAERAIYPTRLTLPGMPEKLAQAKAAVTDLCSQPTFRELNVHRSLDNYVVLAGFALLQATERRTGRLCEIRPRSGANLAAIARAMPDQFDLHCADFSDGGSRFSNGDRIHAGFEAALENYIKPQTVSVHQTFADVLKDCAEDPARNFDVVLTSLPFTSQQMKDELTAIESVLSETGMIVIDDAFSPAWPHCTAGLISYLDRTELLVPLCLHRTCVVLVRREAAARWFIKCESLFRNMLGLTRFGTVELCGKPMFTLTL